MARSSLPRSAPNPTLSGPRSSLAGMTMSASSTITPSLVLGGAAARKLASLRRQSQVEFMSSNHVTPPEIARALARHAPKSVTRVLDPAVGDGSLLLPLLDRVCHSRCEVTAVDIDPAAILSASVRLSHPVAVRELVCSDFLEWARRNPCGNQFDCVVANPPFAGRRSDWVGVTLSRPWVENETDPALCPVEVAFIIACVHALQPGGRLLAIVPSSIVASSRCAWLRRRSLRPRCDSPRPRVAAMYLSRCGIAFLFSRF